MQGIIIVGPAGAGKTTLGRLAARELGAGFLDIDDYIWRTDTPAPYTAMYSREEKIRRLMAAAQAAGTFVMAGSMDSFHAPFDPLFRLAVHLTADADLRLARVHRRELEAFGARILPGGDLHAAHEAFLRETAAYDHGAASCNRERHEIFLRGLSCPILRLDGGDPPAQNMRDILKAWTKVRPDAAR